ncbi:MAG: hypothetical protein H6876_10965 [Hyphomicrobiaceae bacterium]|nr:hypothetical protein [Hyphomicrobiaceae bacterium]MCC0008623.1 hypothetical protein [Hyphomicrobiaceae bacterium]
MTGSSLRLLMAALVAMALAGDAGAVTQDRAQPDRSQSRTMSKAEARREVWPKPVDEFLAGEYLERADVVLTRRDWDLSSYLIRLATKSPFSHAAMVFTGPQFESGFSNTFVIEAGTGGVDLTNIRDYIADKSTFIAVKRLKTPWFDEMKQARVRGILLDKIKASYNYWAIGRIFKNIWFGVQRQVRGKEKTIESYRKNDWRPPNDYICSGLVQLGFVEAVIEYVKADKLPISALKEVVFHDTAASRLPDAADWQFLDKETQKQSADIFEEQNIVELEAVTPDDLARSDKLDWLYLIRDGYVYKVSSYQDVLAQTR